MVAENGNDQARDGSCYFANFANDYFMKMSGRPMKKEIWLTVLSSVGTHQTLCLFQGSHTAMEVTL